MRSATLAALVAVLPLSGVAAAQNSIAACMPTGDSRAQQTYVAYLTCVADHAKALEPSGSTATGSPWPPRARVVRKTFRSRA